MNELVPGGGGAVVPGSDGGGGAVGDYVGDMSVDRGGASGAVANREPGPELVRDLGSALGFDLGAEQIQKAREAMHRHRLAEDERQKAAAVATLRREWGSQYDERARRINMWLGTLPGELGDQIRDARDHNGDPICSKPATLRWMHEVAAATILVSDDERDIAAVQRALKAEWGEGAYHSHIASVKRYLATLPRSVREGLANARDDNDVATLNDPQALKWLLQLARPQLAPPRGGPAPPDHDAINSARIRQLEDWMGAPKGSENYNKYWRDDKVQAEYRALTAVRSDVTPQTADTEVDRRIAEIEAMMGTSRYTRDEAVQKELLELYRRRERTQRGG
jgi:hypothetical protein